MSSKIFASNTTSNRVVASGGKLRKSRISRELSLSRKVSTPSFSKFKKNLQDKTISKFRDYSFVGKIKSTLFVGKNEAQKDKIITSAANLASELQEDLYDKDGIYRQKSSTIACGYAMHLNSLQYKHRNAIYDLKLAIKKLDKTITSTNLASIITEIEKIVEENQESIIGHDKLEYRLVKLQSVLTYSQQNIHNINIDEIAKIKTKVEKELEDLDRQVKSQPIFNSDDLVYSALNHASKIDNDDLIQALIESTDKYTIEKQKTALSTTQELPEPLFNIFKMVHTYSNLQIFDEITQFSKKDSRGIESIQDNETSRCYAARVDMLIWMLANTSKYNNDNKLTNAIIKYLQSSAGNPILNILKSEFSIDVNTIAMQAISFFERFKQQGMLSRQKTHFNLLVYDKETNQARLINSNEQASDENIEGNEAVIAFLGKTKNQAYTLQIIKSSHLEYNIPVYKIDSVERYRTYINFGGECNLTHK